MKLLIAVDSFALSSLVVVSESGDVLRAGTALPSLNAGRVIFMLSPEGGIEMAWLWPHHKENICHLTSCAK